MPCLHKFHGYLNLDRLNFEPTTLIVGTFNPSWVQSNYAEWFYGRTGDGSGNYFWNVLPRIYNQDCLREATTEQWKTFCQENRIALTDLIESIGDADVTNEQHLKWLSDYSDKNIATKFFDHTVVWIPRILNQHRTITNVYLTRGIGEKFWKDMWLPTLTYCNSNNIRCTTLLTPSPYARFQQGAYNRQNPNNRLNLPDYILMRWREVWHPL